MAGVNKVIILGNLGLDPEVRTLESGTKLARLRIATSEAYTSKDGQRIEQTEWHNVVLWRQLADVAERYLTKGSKVYVEGKLKTRSWKDQEGNDRYTTEIVADNMEMIGKGNESTGGTNNQTSIQESGSYQAAKPKPVEAQEHTNNNGDDDLPF